MKPTSAFGKQNTIRMNNKLNSRFFSQVAEKMIRNRSVFGAALCVENGDRSVSWAGASGDINEPDRY